MRRSTLDLLRCVHCRGRLRWPEAASAAVADGELACADCGTRFAVEKGMLATVSREEVAAAYPAMERQARTGARFYECFLNQFVEILGITLAEARAEYLQRLELTPGATVLDVGVGTGMELRWLAERVPDLQMFGLDMSREMLAQCRRKLEKAGLEAELVIGFAERLPFQSDRFDCVFHSESINEFNDPRAAMGEMVRVAKPGARIVIADELITPENLVQPIGRQLAEAFPSLPKNVRPPVDRLPAGVEEIRLATLWNGYGYCLEFRKPRWRQNQPDGEGA